MKRMLSLPNLLSLSRIVIAPFFIVFFMWGGVWLWVALVLFSGAAFTDFCDGYCARKFGSTTGFGVLIDPIADKVLITAALFCFYMFDFVPLWFIGLLVFRDLVVTALRWQQSDKPASIAPSLWGKGKTVIQILLVYLLFLCLWLKNRLIYAPLWYANVVLIVKVVMYAVSIITVYSGFDYVCRYTFFRREK